MQNPFRKSDEDEIDYAKMLSGMEIGTEATRAAIIDKAIAKDYIKLTKNTYTIEPNGRFLVETCRALGIDMSSVKTAEMGRNTKAVSRGEMSCYQVLDIVRKEIYDIINGNVEPISDPIGPRGPQETLLCPRCGKELKDSLNKLECECGFTFWKTIASKRLDNETIKLLLSGEKTPLLKGFKGRSGKAFNAYLIMQPDGKVQFEFPERVPVGLCPKCGKPVFENAKGFGCSGYKDGCDFVIWKYDRKTKTKVSEAQAKKLLAGETVTTKTKVITLEDGTVKIDKPRVV